MRSAEAEDTVLAPIANVRESARYSTYSALLEVNSCKLSYKAYKNDSFGIFDSWLVLKHIQFFLKTREANKQLWMTLNYRAQTS